MNYQEFDRRIANLMKEYTNEYGVVFKDSFRRSNNFKIAWQWNDMVGNFVDDYFYMIFDYPENEILSDGATIELTISNNGVAADYGAMRITDIDVETYDYEDESGKTTEQKRFIEEISNEAVKIGEKFVEDFNYEIDEFLGLYDDEDEE